MPWKIQTIYYNDNHVIKQLSKSNFPVTPGTEYTFELIFLEKRIEAEIEIDFTQFLKLKIRQLEACILQDFQKE